MLHRSSSFLYFFFNETATTEIYTLSLHDALPISERHSESFLKRLWLGLARAGERDPVLGRVYLVCHHMPPNRFAWRRIGSRIRVAFVDIPGDKGFRVGSGGISLRFVDCRSSHTCDSRRSFRGRPIYQGIR